MQGEDMEIEAGFRGTKEVYLRLDIKKEAALIDITEVVPCWACVCRGHPSVCSRAHCWKMCKHRTVCPAELRGVQTGGAQLWNPAGLVGRDSPPPRGWPGHSGWGQECTG